MARQTKERAEQTREAILDAAVAVFFSRGVARASLEEIAQAAGVTRGAVYWHFRDKLDLFAAIDDRLRLPREEELLALVASSPAEPLAALQALLVGVMRRMAEDRALHMQATVVLFRCDYVDDMAPALDRQAAFQRRMAETFRRYFLDVVPPPGAACPWTPAAAAQALHTLLCGVMFRGLRFAGDFSLASDGAALISAFMTGLRNDWTRQS